MTNEELLKRCIEKAVKNGFNFKKWNDNQAYEFEVIEYYPVILIFNHEFLKAFFGKNPVCMICGNEFKKNNMNKICEHMKLNSADIVYITAYSYHAMEMICTNEPIKYLEKYL